MTTSCDTPSVGIQVRDATDSDMAAIGRIAVAAYRADGQLGGEHGYEHALRDAAGRARSSRLLVAVERDRVLGAVALCRPGSRMAEVSLPGELEFRMLSVDPAAQGRGVGRALVQACLDEAVRLGCHAVVICTRDEVAHTAQRLYRRMGFVRLPERDWSPLPGIDLLAWRYEVRPDPTSARSLP